MQEAKTKISNFILKLMIVLSLSLGSATLLTEEAAAGKKSAKNGNHSHKRHHQSSKKHSQHSSKKRGQHSSKKSQKSCKSGKSGKSGKCDPVDPVPVDVYLCHAIDTQGNYALELLSFDELAAHEGHSDYLLFEAIIIEIESGLRDPDEPGICPTAD